MSKKILADQFGKQERWVVWKMETRKGKKTKIPYHPDGTMASSTDKKTWVTYEVAAAAANTKEFDGVGIIFTPSMTLLGIDLDHCVINGEITHALKEPIQRFIEKADTYCELSPSKEGLHLFLQIDEPLELLANKKAPFELYTKGRYFTVTNKPFGEVKAVRTVTKKEAEELLALIGYPWKTDTKPVTPSPAAAVSLNEPLEDKDVLQKMFASKKGDEIKATYDGLTDAFKNDESKADASLLAHLAFYTGRNAAQMERLWLNSPLGSREKTQKRGDYRAKSIKFAVEHCKEVYTPPLHSSSVLDLLYTIVEKRKVYTQNTENMCRILRKYPDFADRFRFDDFRNLYEIKPPGHNEWRPFEDIDAINIQTAISILFPIFQRVGKEMVYDAIMKVSKENAYDSAQDYFRSLKWDGKARLDTWLSKTLGVADDKYHRAVGSNWLKGLVKRVMQPGCKFDYVLVIEGKQGTRKSTLLSILGGDWHVETTMSPDNKDFFMQFQGKAIVEFSEGATLNKADTLRLKAIITTQSDKFRPPYGRMSVDFPRRCVFAMTTNQDEYLKDETGNRRWLPVAMVSDHADTDWLEENRDQLFAEAYYRAIEKDEKVYEFPEEQMQEEQHKRRLTDPNLDAVSDWYWNALTPLHRKSGITTFQVYRDALHNGFSPRPMTRFEEMNISDMLRNFMKLTKKQIGEEAKRELRWFNDIDGIGVEVQLPVGTF
jgi:hypothetical protein